MINSVEKLHDIYVKTRFGWESWRALSQWALDRMVNYENESDEDIILLAGSSFEDDSIELAKKVIAKYLEPERRSDSYWAGKYLVSLYESYYGHEIDIFELSQFIDKINCELGSPGWLVMLSRNCEYATDLECFEIPFHEEFHYIVQLWRSCESLAEFLSEYERAISDSHDVHVS